MCYNCGCGLPDEDHGNPNNLTRAKVAKMANDNHISEEETKDNIMKAFEAEDEEEDEEAEEKRNDAVNDDEDM